MNRRWTFGLLIAALFAAFVAPLPAMPQAGAQGAVTLKIATLFPANSSLFRTLQAWATTVNNDTRQAVTIELVSRGRTADERGFVSGMGDGTYDGALLTASGLNAAAPGVLALAAPGGITDFTRLDRVRTAMASDLNQVFAGAPGGGYRLLGWADYGRARIFSTAPIARPAAMNGRKLWGSRDDVVAAAIASATSASRVQTPMSGVGRAIEGGQIDTVYASSITVVSQNWHSERRLRHVSQQAFGIVVGATVLRTASYNRIPAQHRAAFDSATAAMHVQLNRALRNDDNRNFTTATSRGVAQFDTSPAAAEWNQAFQRATQSMSPSVFPASLLGSIGRVR